MQIVILKLISDQNFFRIKTYNLIEFEILDFY